MLCKPFFLFKGLRNTTDAFGIPPDYPSHLLNALLDWVFALQTVGTLATGVNEVLRKLKKCFCKRTMHEAFLSLGSPV